MTEVALCAVVQVVFDGGDAGTRQRGVGVRALRGAVVAHVQRELVNKSSPPWPHPADAVELARRGAPPSRGGQPPARCSSWPGAVRLQAPKIDPRVVLVSDHEHLFTGTIADNLRLGDPSASEVVVVELLDALGLTRSGVHGGTRTGPGGRPLSGGEERRVHLARAMLARPDILLVDEPDAGLDQATATSVTALLRSRLPEAVLVYTAHLPGGAADGLPVAL